MDAFNLRRDCIHALVKPAEVYIFSDAMDMAALRILPQTMSAPTIDFRFTTIVGYVENVIIEIGGKISIVERLVAVYHRFASIVLLDKPRELSRRIRSCSSLQPSSHPSSTSTIGIKSCSSGLAFERKSRNCSVTLYLDVRISVAHSCPKNKKTPTLTPFMILVWEYSFVDRLHLA